MATTADTATWEEDTDEDPVARTKRVLDYRMGKLLDRFRTLHAPITNTSGYSLTAEQFSKMMLAIDEQVIMLKALGEKRFKNSSRKFQL